MCLVYWFSSLKFVSFKHFAKNLCWKLCPAKVMDVTESRKNYESREEVITTVLSHVYAQTKAKKC